jgi:hypothetical protein
MIIPERKQSFGKALLDTVLVAAVAAVVTGFFYLLAVLTK